MLFLTHVKPAHGRFAWDFSVVIDTVCILKLSYLSYLKSLTNQFLIFQSDLLARRSLYIAASKASGLVSGAGFIMMKDKMQFSAVFVLLHWSKGR